MANFNNGTVTITVSGGTAPYVYTLLDVNGDIIPDAAYTYFSNNQTSSLETYTFGDPNDTLGTSGLAPGDYSIRAVDANGCIINSNLTTVGGFVAPTPTPTASTSATPTPTPTSSESQGYVGLTASVPNTDEGLNVVFAVTTVNIPEFTTVGYTLTGIDGNDLVNSGLMNGTFTIDDQNAGDVMIGIKADNLTEGAETLTMTLDVTDSISVATGELNVDVIINDSSIDIPTPTATATATPTPTPSTSEPVPTATATATATPTPTVSTTNTPTPTPSSSVGVTPTPTVSTTATATPTPTVSTTNTPTPTPSTSEPVPTATATATATPTPTVSTTNTATPTPTASTTNTPTPTVSTTNTPTPTPTSSTTNTPTPTPTSSTSATPTPTPSTSEAGVPDSYLLRTGSTYPYASTGNLVADWPQYTSDNAPQSEFGAILGDWIANPGSYGQLGTVSTWNAGTTSFSYTADGQASWYFIAIPDSAGVPDLTVNSKLSIVGGLGADIAPEKVTFTYNSENWTLYRMNTGAQNAAITVDYV